MITGSAFTAPRGSNRQSFVYRTKPACAHRPYKPVDKKVNYSKVKNNFFNDEDLDTTPQQLRYAT